jgi:signal transduction histidine kinase
VPDTEVSQDGSGLGLSLTKALVELHGGVLDL